MKFKIRFHKIRRSRNSGTSVRKPVTMRRDFRRAPLVLAISAAAVMFSAAVSASPLPPDINNNYDVVDIPASLFGDIVTQGGPWRDASVSVGSGATLFGHVDPITATNIRESLSVVIDGSIAADENNMLAHAIVDESWVDLSSANVGTHTITINNGAGIALSGYDLRSLVTMAVYGDNGTGEQSVTLNGASISLDADSYTGEVHGIDLLLNGDSAVSQSVVINGGNLAVTANEGTATGVSRQGMHGELGGDYLGDFSVVMDGGSITADAASMATGIGAIAMGDATVTLSAGAEIGAVSGTDYATSIYLGDVDGTASVDLAASSLVADAAVRAIGIHAIDAGNVDINLDGATIDVSSQSAEASGIRVDSVRQNANVTVGNGSTIDSEGIIAAGLAVADYNDVAGDSTNIVVDSGASIHVVAPYVASGVVSYGIETATITVDAATVDVSDSNVGWAGFLPVSGVIMAGAAGSGTVNVRNATTVTATGDYTDGILATNGGYFQVNLDDATVASNALMEAAGIATQGATGVSIALNNATLSASGESLAARGIRADDLGYVDVGVTGSHITSTSGGLAAGIAMTNVGSATLALADSSINVTSGAEDGNGLVFDQVDDIDLSLSGTTVDVTGTGAVTGMSASNFGTFRATLADGSAVTAESAPGGYGIKAVSGDTLDVSLTGATITASALADEFAAIYANDVANVNVALDSTTIDVSAAQSGSVAIYGAHATTMNVELVNGSSLISNSDTDSYSGALLTSGNAHVTVDDTSSIIDGGNNGVHAHEGYKGALISIGGTTVLDNAGTIGSMDKAVQTLFDGFINLVNTGVIIGNGYAAYGNVAVDNAGMMVGRMDVASLTSRNGSELVALFDTTTSLAAAGDAYWKVSGAATIEDGTTIRIGVTPALGSAIQANPEGYGYLMLQAGTLEADTAAINLRTGPLLSAVFTPDMPAGEIGVTFQQVDCADAALTGNGIAACEAAVTPPPVVVEEPPVVEDPAVPEEPTVVDEPTVTPDPVVVVVVDEPTDTGSNIDLNANPDSWVPIVSDILREAPRMAARMVSASLRRRLLATYDGDNSGDPTSISQSLWMDGRMTSSTQDAGTGVAGFEADGSTVTIGMDRTLSDELRLGLAVSKANSSADEKGSGNTVDRDATIYSLYGKWESGSLGMEASLSMGNWNNDQVRYAGAEVVTAAYDSKQQGVNALVRYSLGDVRAQVQPELAVSYQKLDIDAYNEKGDGTPASNALAVAGQGYEEGEIGAGAQFSKEHETMGGNILKPSLDLMVWHDLIQDQTRVMSYFLTGSPTFVAEGAPASANRVSATLALEYQGQSGLKVKVGGDLTARDGYLGKAVSLRAEYNF